MNKNPAIRKLFFCKLVIPVYLIAFVLLPLCDIHVEYQFGGKDFFQEESNSPWERFIVLFHELLYSQFSNKADHAICRSVDSSNSDIVFKLLSINSALKSCFAENINLEEKSVYIREYPANQVNSLKAFVGFYPLFPGLSPPSV